MTANQSSLKQSSQQPSFLMPVLIGAGIALLLIVLLLSSVSNPDPAWPKYWQLRPLIVVPLAGATGGFFYYLMRPMRNKTGWQKIAAFIICLIVYVFGLWIGTVLGLDGTLWD
ncbi:MAG: hypothetical protein ACOVP7_07130 [Lacibacter sp.]